MHHHHRHLQRLDGVAAQPQEVSAAAHAAHTEHLAPGRGHQLLERAARCTPRGTCCGRPVVAALVRGQELRECVAIDLTAGREGQLLEHVEPPRAGGGRQPARCVQRDEGGACRGEH
eukprot:scaffold20731_cov60-Phaeocystis_antarctica.AAC.1